MSLSRDSRQERIWKTIQRAKFKLKQNIERINWEEDVLYPEVEALKSGKAIAGLPANTAFEIVIEDANHSAPETDNAIHDAEPEAGDR